MGVIPPSPEFLHALRKLTDAHGMLLIFDEVISGFRVQYGGAQTLYDIKPDLTILGKIIGGGLPVGAYGGAKDIMKMIAPSGPVYQAGTLSGNPLAVTAGIETLRRLKKPGTYEQLEQRSVALSEGLGNAARKAGVALSQTRVSSMMCAFFTQGPVTDWASAKKADTKTYAKFFHQMLDAGIYLAPSQFEAAFMSVAHTPKDIDRTISAAQAAFKNL
jgi:glutamate-1-semialdehyde 2,1-aminomutase